MEIHEYVEMLEKLKVDRQETLFKLSAIEAAIEALQPLCGVDNEVKMSSVGIFSEASPSSVNSVKKSFYDDYEIEIPDVYDVDLSPIEKLLFSLSQKDATAHDAASYILEIDKNSDIELLKRRFTDIASGLARAKKINYKKIGKKFKYSLKQEDIERKKVA